MNAPMNLTDPPYDGSASCPMCPVELRNLYAVAHSITTGASDTCMDDLRRAVDMAKPFIDAHFADSMHSRGVVNRG